MTTTNFYVPAMYFRNIVGSHVVSPDHWMQLAAEKPAGVNHVELIIDSSNFVEYAQRLKEIAEFCRSADVVIPIVRISACELYQKDNKAAFDALTSFLTATEAVFGPILVQLETLSAWQTYEIRNSTVLDPDNLPAGYRYSVYAKHVLNTIMRFSEICKEVGVTAAIEPRVGHVISSPDSVMRLVTKDGLPFKLVFDVSHMEFQGINTCDAWDVLKEYSAVVHVSDTDTTSAHHTQVASGVVPWRTLLGYTARHESVSLLGVEIFSSAQDEAEIKAEYAKNVGSVRDLVKKYRISEYFG